MKYTVNLRIETSTGVECRLYTVTARNSRLAGKMAAEQAMDDYGRSEIVELTVQEVWYA